MGNDDDDTEWGFNYWVDTAIQSTKSQYRNRAGFVWQNILASNALFPISFRVGHMGQPRIGAQYLVMDLPMYVCTCTSNQRAVCCLDVGCWVLLSLVPYPMLLLLCIGMYGTCMYCTYVVVFHIIIRVDFVCNVPFELPKLSISNNKWLIGYRIINTNCNKYQKLRM